MAELTQARLKEVLSYDPETGVFIRISAAPRMQRFVGTEAGRVHKKRGYREISVDGRLYYAHRLAFLYMTGAFPKEETDHKNHRRDDNSWANLRQVTVSENQLNRTYQGGASLYRSGEWVRWRARKQVAGVTANLGYFKTREQAIAACQSTTDRIG